MLEQQLWMDYAMDLNIEWKQANDEGRDVEELKSLCEWISQQARSNEDYKGVAREISQKLLAAPVKSSYKYDEPSLLEDIKEARPNKRHTFVNTMCQEELRDKVAGAWIGRISGCLLGKPVEGVKREALTTFLKKTDNYPMHKYIMEKDFNDEKVELLKERYHTCWADTLKGIAPVDDDTNYTVFAMKLVENYGKDFRPNDVLEAWLSWIPMFATCTAERIAYRNAAMGMYAPETATYFNPYREWIGAQIRGDFFGYINPAMPEKAAEMAWRDASISHVKNGIYGEMFIAAMIAAAGVSEDMMTVIEAGLDEIPEMCRLREDVEHVVQWYREGLDEEELIQKIHDRYDEHDCHHWCHTNSNAMIVVLALLYGNKELGKSICLAVQAAFDTDCNGATVGSIVGMMIGKRNMPSYWWEVYEQRLATSIEGYNEVTIDELTSKTLSILNNN